MLSLCCLESSWTIRRRVFLTRKLVVNLSSPEGYVSRAFIYETNVFEDGGKVTCTTNILYSRRSYLFSCKPSVAPSEKYLIQVQIRREHKRDEEWGLVLIEYNINDLEQAETIVRIRKNDNAPMVSTLSCFQQFLLGLFFLKEIFSSRQVIVGSEFNNLYSIQDSKMHDKQLVLPRQRIKMDLDPVSRPFYDRGFNWMVILCKYEFFLIRLPQDLGSPPRIVTLGRNPTEPGHG